MFGWWHKRSLRREAKKLRKQMQTDGFSDYYIEIVLR